MRVIFSYVDFGLKEKNYSKILKMAAASNFLAQKCGYKTTLFVDKKSCIFFEKIKYDNLILLKEEITENLPKKIWSLGKLLAMSEMTEPFIHIDFDILLLKPLEKHFEKKEFICLHSEEWMLFDTRLFVDLCKNLNINILNPISLNCGIVGGRNFSLIKKTANKLINYAINNKITLEKINNKIPEKDRSWLLAVLFEQILFTNSIFNNLNLKYQNNLIINTPKHEQVTAQLLKNGIIHLWTNKDKEINLNLIENILNNNLIRY
jgi:hypothetical protein